MIAHDLQRRVAQAARRHIDDTLELEVVGRVRYDFEIGGRVLDFGALIEPRAADHAIGQPQRYEPVFERAHLIAGAYQNRDLAQFVASLAQALDLVGDGAGLFFVVPHTQNADPFASIAFGEQGLAEALLVMRDKMRRGGQNMAGRPVVAFQTNHQGARKILLEAQDIIHFGAAPAINRLVVITHTANIGAARLAVGCHEAQPEILRDVGILVLVDQDVPEAALVLRQHVGMVLKHAQHFEQKIAEIGCVQLLQALLIGAVQLDALAVGKVESLTTGHFLGRQTAVFPAVDGGCQLPGRPALGVDATRLDQLLQQPDLIVGVQNREIGLQTGQFRVPAQDFDAYRMKCAEPGHTLDGARYQMRHPLAHFARGLVGEGDGQNLIALGLAGRQNVRDAGGQDPGFSGAGAGQHEHRAVERFHRRTLLRVQSGQERRRVWNKCPPRHRAFRNGRAPNCVW